MNSRQRHRGLVIGMLAAALLMPGSPGTSSAAGIPGASGGGSIPGPAGGTADFAFTALLVNGTFVHLQFADRDFGLTMTGSSFAGAPPFFLDPCSRRAAFDGQGDSNDGPVIWAVDVTDNGNPGTADTFSIVIFRVPNFSVIYAASGLLQTGNIMVNGDCPQ